MFRTLKLAALLLIPILVLSAVAYAGGMHISAAGKILEGVSVQGVDIGGLSVDEAINKLKQLERQLMTTPVTISYQDRSISLSLKAVDFRVDKEQTIKNALELNNQGSIIERWQKRRHIAKHGLVMPPVLTVDKDKLAEAVSSFADQINVPPQNATITVDEHDQVLITPSKDGRKVDVDQLCKNLLQELQDKTPPDKINLLLPVVTVPPDYTTEEIKEMGITGLLSSYSTKFDPKMTNRAYNIRVAANALDGLLVTPGQEVSFNEVVGPRSSEAGYKSAGVIINNEMVEGLGGGVCQVSSTLYNAVLLADIEVTERSNHSLPVSYVPIGRDATVVYGAVDFKFRNNTGRCLYIKTLVQNGVLTIKIFGDTSHKHKVILESNIEKVLEPKVIYEPDENLKVGQQVVKQAGSKGYVASLKRVVLKDGVIIREDKLPISRYNAVNKIIAVGTAQPKPVITPPMQESAEKLLPKENYLNPEDADNLEKSVPEDEQRASDQAGSDANKTKADEDNEIDENTDKTEENKLQNEEPVAN